MTLIVVKNVEPSFLLVVVLGLLVTCSEFLTWILKQSSFLEFYFFFRISSLALLKTSPFFTG